MTCNCIGCRTEQPCVVEVLIAKQIYSKGHKCISCGEPRSNGSVKLCRKCHLNEVNAQQRSERVVSTCERCNKPKSSGRGRFCRGCYNAIAAERKSYGNLVKDGRPRSSSLPFDRTMVIKPRPVPVPRPYESVMNEPPPAIRKVLSRTDVTSRFFNDPR